MKTIGVIYGYSRSNVLGSPLTFFKTLLRKKRGETINYAPAIPIETF
jgi:hypothetical protein